MALDDYDISQFDRWCDEVDGDLDIDEDGFFRSCYIGNGSNVRVEKHGAFRVDDRGGDIQTRIDTDLHNVPLADSVRQQGKLLSIGTGGRDGTVVNVSPPRD